MLSNDKMIIGSDKKNYVWKKFRGRKMSRFLTPEEMVRKRERNKRLFYVSIPLIGALIGAVIALFSNMI